MLRPQNDIPEQSTSSSSPENTVQKDEPTTPSNSGNPIENIASLTDSVLLLEVFDHLDNGIGTASGFLIRDNSTLITNFHVIENANRIIVKSSSGAYFADLADVLAYDEIADIAILQCDKEIQVLPLELGNSDTVRQGNIVYAVGYPLGIANTLSNGIVSSRYTDEYGVDILQITTPISEGSSGGALLNESGAVVGVVCASYIDGQNMNIAIASNTVSQLLSQVQSAIDLKSYYSRWHPQVEFDEYDACIRMITLTSETLAQQVYDEWLSGDATEETLIEIMDAYGSDQGGSQLHTVQPGDFSDEVEQWCFDETRRIGDIEIIEHDKGFSICYFCGAVERNQLTTPIKPITPSTPENSTSPEPESSHGYVAPPSEDSVSHRTPNDENTSSSPSTEDNNTPLSTAPPMPTEGENYTFEGRTFEVPSFGYHFNVPLYSSHSSNSGSSAFRFFYAQVDLPFDVKTAISAYGNLLMQHGYKYSHSGENSQGTTDYYKNTKYTVSVGINAIEDGFPFQVVIMLGGIIEPPEETATPEENGWMVYQLYGTKYSVPDYGYYFGKKPLSCYTSGTSAFFHYDPSDLDGDINTEMEKYGTLLSEYGFSFSHDLPDGNHVYKSDEYSVIFGINNGANPSTWTISILPK